MTAALEGGEWSAARPGCTLPPGKTRYPLYRRLGGPQGRSGRAENVVPTGIRSRTVQPVVAIPTELPGPQTITVLAVNVRLQYKAQHSVISQCCWMVCISPLYANTVIVKEFCPCHKANTYFIVLLLSLLLLLLLLLFIHFMQGIYTDIYKTYGFTIYFPWQTFRIFTLALSDVFVQCPTRLLAAVPSRRAFQVCECWDGLSECWVGSQDSKLLLHASHVALPT